MWIDRIQANPDDLTIIADCIEHYEREYGKALPDLKCIGRIGEASAKLPAQVEKHFSAQKELEVILRIIERRVAKLEGIHHKKYREFYNRDLTARDIDRYIAAEDDVYNLTMLQYRFAALVNKYSGISKGLEIKHYQIGNITRLRAAGLDDAMFD